MKNSDFPSIVVKGSDISSRKGKKILNQKQRPQLHIANEILSSVQHPRSSILWRIHLKENPMFQKLTKLSDKKHLF